MEWLFIAGLALGIPLAVPPIVQAIDGLERESDARPSATGAFAGFALTAFGIAGLLALGFSAEPVISVVASGALGVACGALHPDLLGWLRRRNGIGTADGAEAPETPGTNVETDA